MDNLSSQRRKGVIYTAGSFALWGVLPLYWKVIKQVPAYEILSHRIFWSFIFVGILVFFQSKWGEVIGLLKDRRKLILGITASLLVGANWFVYIWSVNSGHIVEASLGYYINPLMAVLCGTIFLKEKLSKAQVLAVIVAFVGVINMIISIGKLPWISLVLAITFALYGLCKKLLNLDAKVSLMLETLILAPFAFGFIIFSEASGSGSYFHSPLLVTLFLTGAGIATATPLLWFAEGARRLDLSTVGFIQYLSPTISLGIGVFVFGETFTRTHLITFGFIWVALLIYTLSQFNILKFRKVEKPINIEREG